MSKVDIARMGQGQRRAGEEAKRPRPPSVVGGRLLFMAARHNVSDAVERLYVPGALDAASVEELRALGDLLHGLCRAIDAVLCVDKGGDQEVTVRLDAYALLRLEVGDLRPYV